jgi:enamine deaminase RidA (YjgF/YER057c/UK114 family)
MSASALGARQRQDVVKGTREGSLPRSDALVTPQMLSPEGGKAPFSRIVLGDSLRLALMLAPRGRGSFREQVREVLQTMRSCLNQAAGPMRITSQTVFVRDPADQVECEQLLAAHYGPDMPVTTFVFQPPCCNAALAIEAWAVGGPSVGIERFGPHTVAVTYDGVRWIYCGGITPAASTSKVHEQTTEVIAGLRHSLEAAGCGLGDMVRTWYYLGNITGPEEDTERYKELNRARSDDYQGITFFPSTLSPASRRPVYPASTGIGMRGNGLVAACTAFQTRRKDTFLLPLENPQQTPAYEYHPKYSPQSPKFSRAMALVTNNYVVTWVSGTASIVNSESRHEGDVEKQTDQTIDNIERLIAPANFAGNGVSNAGSALSDLAKLRVYVKRPEDFVRCKAVCERRFGSVPAIYALADVCRPELLVEIEGVAFSPRPQPGSGA